MSADQPDVLVLGLGAAGARAAAVMASAGLRVVAVEAGGWEVGDGPAERGSRPLGNDWFRQSMPWVRRSADEPAAAPTEPAAMVNAVGGSNHRSARQSYRLDLDAMPARWPLTTVELLPYYARVEEAVRTEPSPSAPWTETMRAAAAGLGWDTIPAPVATAPPLGHHELAPLIAGGHLEIHTDTIALTLLCEDGGAVIGAEVLRGGERSELRARRVVLAAHTFENVRLLLLSRSAAHPGGVGNSAGQVGRGFATHNLLLAHGHFPDRDLARRLGAPGHAIAVVDFDREDPTGVSFRGGSILQAAMGASDAGRVAAATGLPSALVHEVGGVWAQPEQLPRASNRLDLDPSRSDPLGRPLLVATHDLDDEDRARAGFLLARMEEWLRAAGASRTWASEPRPNALSTHAYGGTAMGADPTTSVVDSFGQVHDAPGLFVLGASTFPGTGGRGPTETVEALAWRTADRIVEELAG